jgi:acetate kinase
MATRSGDVDPGLLLWLAERMPLAELGRGLEHDSGLAGLGGSGDMRALLDADGDDEAASLAIDVYLHRLRAGIAAMAAAMGGLDALVFTGGVGQRSARIRAEAVDGLSFLGGRLEAVANETAVLDTDVASGESAVRVLVIEAREDLEVAQQVRACLGAATVRTNDGERPGLKKLVVE